jgi:hypothetical protein
MAVQTKDYTANYKGIGVETSVDFEARYAGQGFDDIRAVGAKTGLEALMLGEEAMILGGCSSTTLGTTPTPTLTALTTGGTLAAQTWSVICAAMTLDGLMNGSIAGGVQGSITRSNGDLTSDTFGGGVGKISAGATVATTGATGSINASVTPVVGALGYAWFWGAAGSEKLGTITTINSSSRLLPAEHKRPLRSGPMITPRMRSRSIGSSIRRLSRALGHTFIRWLPGAPEPARR